MDPEILLGYTMEGLKDTMGPNGLVPSLLVFDTIISFPIINKLTDVRKSRTEIIKMARNEVFRIRTEK